MHLKHVYHLGIKEILALIKDPMLFVLIVYTFTLSIYIASTAQPETLSQIPIGIVDEDNSSFSQRLVSSFYPPQFTPPYFINIHEMDRGMDQGIYTFTLDIPVDFQKNILAGNHPTIQLNVDATRLSQAFTGASYIQTIIQKEASFFLSKRQSLRGAGGVEIVARTSFNPELNVTWFGGVLEIINNITMLSIGLVGAALIREREHGTIEHLLVMPVTPIEIMLSKVWSMGAVILVMSGLSLLLVVQAILKMPIQGSLLLLLVATILHLFATTSLGIFLSTVSKTMPQFALLLILLLLPLQLLSGGMTPRESMPMIIQKIMLLAPNTHFVMMAQAILFRGAGFSIIWPNLMALLAIGGSLFVFSQLYFKKMISKM